jgi:hypothetical protein
MNADNIFIWDSSGRFFASLQSKIILAELLINYHISFPPGHTKTPKNMAFNLFVVPSRSARLIFTRRVTAKD